MVGKCNVRPTGQTKYDLTAQAEKKWFHFCHYKTNELVLLNESLLSVIEVNISSLK